MQINIAVSPSKNARWQPTPIFMTRVGITLAIVVGALVRLFPVLSVTTPLNDGGLFYLMAHEIAQAQFRLPIFTSYNDAQIPFTYPPLGLYLAAALAQLRIWSLFDIVRVLPAVISIFTIPAFYFLCRGLLRSPLQIAVAVWVFALVPTTWCTVSALRDSDCFRSSYTTGHRH